MSKTSRLRHLKKLAPAVRFAARLALRFVSFKAVITYLLAILAIRGIESGWRRLRQGLGGSHDDAPRTSNRKEHE